MKKCVFAVFMLSFCACLFCMQSKLNQVRGKWENAPQKKLKIENLSLVSLKEDDIVFKGIVMMRYFNDKLFLLSKDMGKMFVIDKTGRFLYTVGRPGQGPGDLFYPEDFYISPVTGDIHFVYGSMSNCIDVFANDGQYKKRINLKSKKMTSGFFPSRLLLVNENYYFGYMVNENLVDVFDANGEFVRDLIKRKDKIIPNGKNMANNSQLLALKKERAVIHLNHFYGIFTKIGYNGEVLAEFSVKQSPKVLEVNRQFEDRIYNSKDRYTIIGMAAVKGYGEITSDFDDNLYLPQTVGKMKTDKEPNIIYVFSANGDFLYVLKVAEIEKNEPEDQIVMLCWGSQNQLWCYTKENNLYVIQFNKR